MRFIQMHYILSVNLCTLYIMHLGFNRIYIFHFSWTSKNLATAIGIPVDVLNRRISFWISKVCGIHQ